MLEEYKNLINVDCDCVLNTEALLIAEANPKLELIPTSFAKPLHQARKTILV